MVRVARAVEVAVPLVLGELLLVALLDLGRIGYLAELADVLAYNEVAQRADVEFVGEPRVEPYGQVVVFRDIAGNRWDLLGPA